MDDFIANLGYVIAALVAWLAVFLRKKRPGETDMKTLQAGVGIGYIQNEQMDRLIAEVKRIGDIMSDKNTAGINDALEEQAAHIKDLMKMLEKKTIPPRRR